MKNCQDNRLDLFLENGQNGESLVRPGQVETENCFVQTKNVTLVGVQCLPND